MYAPHQFREERRAVLVAAMRDIQLAAVVTPDADGLCATHAPVVVREEGETLLLEFHVARQNPHWKLGGAKSLMIFQGPQAYIRSGLVREQGRAWTGRPDVDLLSWSTHTGRSRRWKRKPSCSPI